MGERSREEESSLRGYEHEFLRAAEALSKGAEGFFVSDAQKIKLYALYKQGTLGDCNKSQPGEILLLFSGARRRSVSHQCSFILTLDFV